MANYKRKKPNEYPPTDVDHHRKKRLNIEREEKNKPQIEDIIFFTECAVFN